MFEFISSLPGWAIVFIAVYGGSALFFVYELFISGEEEV